MKKTFLLFATFSYLVACTPKAAKTTVGPAPASPSASSAPTEAELTAAKTKFPDVTMDKLKQGHSIYFGACTNCHGAKNITRRDEKEWTNVLNEMAPKANLNADEKDAVWKYIMAVKLAAK